MRALIVDDSPAAQQVAYAALEEAAASLGLDVEIETAPGGVPALRVLAQSEVAILLVDLHMPDLHGLEVLSFWKQRRQQRAGVAVVISTAVSTRDQEKALEAGASAFLEKPVDAAALVEVLKGVAGGAE